MTVHLVYPFQPGVHAAPWSIGNHLGDALGAAGHTVCQYDWTDPRIIAPAPGDALIGHPHPSGECAFTGSLLRGGWRRAVAITPYGGLPSTEATLAGLVSRLDALALICGPTWAARIPEEWRGLAVPVDMAIDRACYPRVRRKFNPPGERVALYVGCAEPSKGVARITELVRRTGVSVLHVGHGQIPGTLQGGYVPLTSPQGRSLVAQCDLLVAPGVNDANPTVVLEAASMGLVALCTEGAGWGEDVCVRAADDLSTVVDWMTAPGEQLEARRSLVDSALDGYTWARFCSTILALI